MDQMTLNELPERHQGQSVITFTTWQSVEQIWASEPVEGKSEKQDAKSKLKVYHNKRFLKCLSEQSIGDLL